MPSVLEFHRSLAAAALGRFNGFLKSVILRVSEARDLGELTALPSTIT